jgi:hypothetical protein
MTSSPSCARAREDAISARSGASSSKATSRSSAAARRIGCGPATPDALLRLASRLVPGLREVVSSADGVTFWATDAKARAELGTRPRTLREGMRDTFGSTPAAREN